MIDRVRRFPEKVLPAEIVPYRHRRGYANDSAPYRQRRGYAKATGSGHSRAQSLVSSWLSGVEASGRFFPEITLRHETRIQTNVMKLECAQSFRFCPSLCLA
jgi:hypothetical protein